MGHVLIASDKFKGSLSALQVGEAVGRGLGRVRPGVDVVLAPVADGGDGTVAAAVAAGFTPVPVVATGPTGEPVETAYARRGVLAVVEVADVCGLGRLPHGQLAPMAASSRGVGEVIGAVLDAGCDQIVLGIGGSACTDGGAGMVRALGARLLDGRGRPLAEGGAALAEVARVDLAGLDPRLARTDIVIASDVDNPLTGQYGAAYVYGPQKGATPDQVRILDAALTRWAVTLATATGTDLRDQPGAGAAGGIGFAGLALLAGTLRPGIDLVLDLIGFTDHLDGAWLVVTGEGALDEQTLRGKAPAGVAARARDHGIPVVAVCGTSRLTPDQLHGAGIGAVYALHALEPDLQRCINNPEPLLERLGQIIARQHLRP